VPSALQSVLTSKLEPGMGASRSHVIATYEVRPGSPVPQVGRDDGLHANPSPADCSRRHNPAITRDDPGNLYIILAPSGPTAKSPTSGLVGPFACVARRLAESWQRPLPTTYALVSRHPWKLGLLFSSSTTGKATWLPKLPDGVPLRVNFPVGNTVSCDRPYCLTSRRRSSMR
jgi:hypothetical protein